MGRSSARGGRRQSVQPGKSPAAPHADRRSPMTSSQSSVAFSYVRREAIPCGSVRHVRPPWPPSVFFAHVSPVWVSVTAWSPWSMKRPPGARHDSDGPPPWPLRYVSILMPGSHSVPDTTGR